MQMTILPPFSPVPPTTANVDPEDIYCVRVVYPWFVV